MTTTDKAPVTAQDFLDSAVESWDSGGNITVDNDKTKSAWELLLSRARQQAFSEGRKAGLKEMDEAFSGLREGNWKKYENAQILVQKLRQEYSAK